MVIVMPYGHGHALWSYPCLMFMAMPYGHGHALWSWPCLMVMAMPYGHDHALWSWSCLMVMVMVTVVVSFYISLDRGIFCLNGVTKIKDKVKRKSADLTLL